MPKHIRYLVRYEDYIAGGFRICFGVLGDFLNPLSIKSWQSDNGSENLGEFDEQLKTEGIPHYFSYPHCPKINTYIDKV